MNRDRLSPDDKNTLLRIERNVLKRYDPGEVTHLEARGLIERDAEVWVLTAAGRQAVNGQVASEWRTMKGI